MLTETGFETVPLYKYQACPPDDPEKKDWVRQILVEHQLFLPSRNCFNDPFDCLVPGFSQTPATILKRFVEERVQRVSPSAAEDEKAKEVLRLMSVDWLEDLHKYLQDEVDRAGVVCFSEIRDDILMWAHYADKHRGLCFEFDGSAFGGARPVEYQDYTPIPLGEDSDCQVRRVILTKSKHWSYEREYRIVRPEEAGRKVPFPPALLTGIIFGCMMRDDLRASVRQWANDGDCHVAFFESRLKPSGFVLDIVRID